MTRDTAIYGYRMTNGDVPGKALDGEHLHRVHDAARTRRVMARDRHRGAHECECSAPCSGRISVDEYNENVAAAVEFLKKGGSDSLKLMTERMNIAAENLDFELAAKLRDRIKAVKRITEKQKVVEVSVKEQDAVSMMSEGEDICFAVIRFSDGRLYDKEDFLIRSVGRDINAASARADFLKQYYSMRDNIPPVITLDSPPEDEVLLLDWLSEKRGKKVYFEYPQKGEKQHILEMCRQNAAERLAQSHGHLGHELSALDELAGLLGLSKQPEFIESYDISNLMGTENVAGMVVFRNGISKTRTAEKASADFPT